MNLFYYKPSFSRYNATNIQAEDAPEDSRMSFIINLAVHSRSPLLVKLLCFSKTIPDNNNPETEDDSDTAVPINTLPTSYLDSLSTFGKKNLEKGKDQNNFPLMYKDNRILLQLVFLNMPKTELENSDPAGHSDMPPEAVENLTRSMQSQPECYNSLSTEQQLALVEIESRVKWLLVEETLHGLLKAPNISTPILNYVEKKLSKSNPYTGQNISIVIPFHFVKNNADSRKIFMKELEKDSYNNNTKYRLRRLGDYFYVSEDSVFNMGDEASYSNSNSPVTTENPPPSSEPESQCEDYCEGLGITLNTSCNKTDDENILANDADVSLCKRPLYWLIIVPRKSHIQIYYYSKIQTLESNSEILNAVKEKIKNIEERTNRMSLLNYLQETRICSAYLEVPGSSEEAKAYSDVESDESLSSDEPSDIFASADIKTGREYRSSFLPGQFSCPLVFTKRFPLHWRLQPNISLKFLTSDVLRLFKVINRSNTFVIERDESIVYCKIFEEVAGEHNQDSPNTVCSSPGQSDRLKSVEEDAKTIASFSIESSTKRDLAVAAATSPSRKRTASSSRTIGNESRDLVVQVYGINLPSWVESEFIDMIENRLITQITLTEVQQFLARNSTSKPTLADVEFILPIWKTPTRKEIVRVPRAIDNPGLFLHYFGQTIAADNIKSLNSPYIGDVLKRYHTDTFYNENNDIVGGVPKIQPDSHHNSLEETLLSTACFYYNCTKRVPGSSTPLELLVGQGMVGVCVTLLDEAGLPMTKVKREGSRNYSFDPETARHCLEQDFREVAAEDAYYHISLNFWSIGSLDSDALMQHLYECYRQSLCDYFIEKTVSMDFSMVLSDKKALQKAIATKSKGRLGTILRNKFVDSVLYTLKTASQMNSPTVYCMNKPIKTTPWCMDDLLRHLDATLRKIDINLRPVVASTPYNKEQWDSDIDACTTNNEWVLYKDYEHLHQQKIQENIRLVAISGLQEFVEKFGNISHASAQERRLSTTSLLGSQKSTSRRNSGDSAMTDHSGNQRNAKSRQDRSRASSTISNPGSIQKNGPQLDSKKHCFLILTLNESDLSIYTYNWSESLSFDLFKNISSFASRQEARIGILTNILHQKMGLFHHTEPIKDCVERFVSPSEQNVRFVPVNGTSSSIFSPSVPQSHVGSPIAKKPSQVDTSGMLSATASRGSTRRSTESSILPLANMLDFKDTITYTANVPRRNQLEAHKSNETAAKSKEQDTYFDKILQRSLIKSNELDQALMDSITNSVAETPFGREFDTLRRHGQSFLEAFLRRSKVQSAHRKALKVYIKWRKRYGDPQAGLDAAEKLSRQDVSTIMRSSRVLHFCRTPLIFCDPEKDWMSITQGQTTQHIASWYKDMADVLISEYAAYLEKADMQPIEFAKSEDEESQCVMVLSEFDFGKHLKAGCSPAYLLSVFEGGSIVCEIRITGIFLSVTLYTLHRQYGRLDYKRFRPETRSKKRENFRKFEKNSGQFKQMIHINSFVYDFHIRYLQKALDDPEHLPNNFDIMIFVRKLALSNILPSPFSKARITRGLYQIQTVNINPTTFFENLFKISTRCGFRNVLLKNSFSTTSISSTTPFFDKNYNENSNSNWKYTLVLSPSSENEIKSSDLDFTSRKNAKINPTYSITIEYFVLVSNQERMTPQNMTKKSWSTSQRLFNDFTSLSEITLIDEGYSLIDILHGAKAKIDYIVSEVTTTSKQIENWNKLYSADLSVPKADHSEFIDLINKFEHTDITKLDNDIASVFKMKLDWDAVLKTVIAVTRNNTKNFYANRNRHLLMYNARFMDFMVHLKVSQDNTIQGWLVTREKRANGIYVEGAERDQVINLSKMLYYHLWRVISNKSIV
ncbi:hypothetical protein G6F56_001128 [Rhizopus delemar]|nr:hypothetical protein G6F56_001128 [Rhizopus delemar]